MRGWDCCWLGSSDGGGGLANISHGGMYSWHRAIENTSAM